MSCYDALAGAYDTLTADVRYRRRADWLERMFRKAKLPVRTVLDLACGTGTLACLLAEKGYEVTAVDGSVEMLTQAARKAASLKGRPPFFLHQPMQRLHLLSPVDAAVSTLDSLNYLTRPQDVQEAFRRVYRYLRNGGLFIFDVNSPYKLRRMDGQVWLDETENVYCVWRTEFSEKTKVCTYWVDLFERDAGGLWRRSGEKHRERAWENGELRQWLTDAGFDRVRISGDLRQSAPRPDEDRLVFRCEKRL
jgi:ubiquinone/menaquinone biosynthesis C-methylase UbiE